MSSDSQVNMSRVFTGTPISHLGCWPWDSFLACLCNTYRGNRELKETRYMALFQHVPRVHWHSTKKTRGNQTKDVCSIHQKQRHTSYFHLFDGAVCVETTTRVCSRRRGFKLRTTQQLARWRDGIAVLSAPGSEGRGMHTVVDS